MSQTSSQCWSTIARKRPSPKQHQQVANLSHVLETSTSVNGIAIAVVDATAIIQGGETLTNCADKFVSVSEVINEVRDPVSRHKLAFVPFTVQTMQPSTEALKKVTNFARATGDLQTLSDVDLKLIALTYTLETQIHGTKHLRETPPPLHVVNVKKLPEKELAGWGSNIPNIKEWEALENEIEDKSNSHSKILRLNELNLNAPPGIDFPNSENGLMGNSEEDKEEQNSRKPRRYLPKKREVKIEGKKMVADGIDASKGEVDVNASDWLPAVSRSTHRRFLRRKARREMYDTSSEKDQLMRESSEEANVENVILEEGEFTGEKHGAEDISEILKQMRIEEKDSEEVGVNSEGNLNETFEGDGAEIGKNGGFDEIEISSLNDGSALTSCMDDDTSEENWMLRSLSESSVACVTSDFSMQNVILQMGLRLLAPGGMQIRQLHRWILKCHACNQVTSETGRIFCPKCGNGGTLRKVAVTVGENGIILASRRPRITLRGTKFSLPLPQGGRDAVTKNPVLREDQLPHKLLYPKTKKKASQQGDDFFSRDDIFCHHTDKKSPLKPPVRKALAVFSGKRNPNDNHFSRSKH